MSYYHLDGESNQDREKRLASEYDAYVVECKTNGVEPTAYTNWLSSKKYHENNP